MNKITKYGAIPMLVVAGGIMAIGIAASDPEETQHAEVAQDDPTSTPRYFCRYAIKQVLHDPSSAEWIDYREWPAFFDDDGLITVTARYRATNAFGATVTEQTVCDMRVEGDEYRLIEFR